MRKLILLFILLFSLSFISAVEFDIKNSYSQGETLIAKLSGNFVDTISRENIFFYEDYVRVPVQYDVAKIEDEYYLYALLPEKQKNYSISIEDVKYYQGSKIIEDDIKRNFSTTSELADFSLEPGFVITSELFSLKIQNLQDSKRTIKIDFDGKETEFTLKSGEKKTINFKVENIYQDNLKKIKLSSDKTTYEVPIYVFTDEPQVITGKNTLRFEVTNNEINMPTNFEKKKIIYLKNIGEENLENISLSLTEELKPYINLSTQVITELKKNSSRKIELTIKSKDDEKNIIGEIKAKISGETYTSATFYLNFVKDYIPINETSEDGEGNIILTQTCDELGGKVCSETEICDTEEVDSFEGNCCLTTCKAKTTSSTGQIIGWSIVVIILIILAWFFLKKYRGAKGPMNILEKAKGR